MAPSTSLTLYQFNTCPFCWKVKALLNYTQQPYKTVEVTPFSMKELDFTDHNKVPVLTDGDKVIVESADIVEYVNQHYSQLAHTDNSAISSQWINEALARYLPILIHPSFTQSFKHLAITLDGIKLNPIKRFFLRSTGALIMPRVAKRLMTKHNIEQPQQSFLANIDHWVEQGLQGKTFHGDNKPDFIDCSVFGVLYSSHNLGVIDQATEHNAEFKRWYNACLPLMTTSSNQA